MKIQDVDARSFRHLMGKFATGVTLIGFDNEGELTGMTANAFISLSVNPAMVLISVRQQARFANRIKVGDIFGISFLREEHEKISSHFGGRPDSTQKVNFTRFHEAPVLGDALVKLAVRANSIHVGGDHLIYTADVEAVEESDGRPLLFFSGSYKQLHALDPANCWLDTAY